MEKLDSEKAIFFGKDPDYLIEKLSTLNINAAKKFINNFNNEKDRMAS